MWKAQGGYLLFLLVVADALETALSNALPGETGAAPVSSFAGSRRRETALSNAVPAAVSGAVGASWGRRALRAARRAQSLRCSRLVVAFSSDNFESFFVPYRRVISCDDDLLALDTLPHIFLHVHAHRHGLHLVLVFSRACALSSWVDGGIVWVVRGSMHVDVWLIQEVITVITVRGSTVMEDLEEREDVEPGFRVP